MVELAELPRERLEDMAAAGAEIMECYRLLRKSDGNVVAEVLRGHGEFYEWDHYPPGDVYDKETHSQYYYHAHPAELRGGEHGHFHTFLRPKGMPEGVAPAALPDYSPPSRGQRGAQPPHRHFHGSARLSGPPVHVQPLGDRRSLVCRR